MTCHCPPRGPCYFRADCRRGNRLFSTPPSPKPAQPQPIAAARLMWLEDRHDALVEELQGELRPAERKSKAAALLVIDEAIARHSR